jgi:hypothetical protein
MGCHSLLRSLPVEEIGLEKDTIALPNKLFDSPQKTDDLSESLQDFVLIIVLTSDNRNEDLLSQSLLRRHLFVKISMIAVF